ncbi:chaperone modulator CbpM [Falsihalocynthiibacter arcticus]|uniref:HTH merR-type domain-containing protein n=1 Tax=Falsihalocynthiibacter arcticus TaxID=1579316 RepID=A0A126V3M8_9RHOB|nr:chaperone modulator CbpM [Falsihalocynthiibacter arcticus]AML52893.1 hypothetical protein RC74_17980 [Falsihalocynthiibacter arcticus]
MMTEAEVLAKVQGLSVTRLRICVQEAWVAPATGQSGPLFDDLDLARLQLIADLNEDMEVNDEALPIILSLIDQLNANRRLFHALDQAINAQEVDIQENIVACIVDAAGQKT